MRAACQALLASAALCACAGAAAAQYAGPAVSSPPKPASAPVSAMHADYESAAIMPGDLITINAYGIPELSAGNFGVTGTITAQNSGSSSGIRVGAAGEVVLPFVGTIKLGGMTASQASVFLAKALKDAGILNDPQVSVQFLESPSRIITVLGEVMRPAPVSAFANFHLLDVISACGGLTPLASHTVAIRRAGLAEPIVVELGSDSQTASASNIPLIAGDTVVVSKVGNVYVVGQVKTPAAIPLSGNTPLTVMRAVAVAGGLNYGASLTKARIIRTTADNRHIEIMLDLKKIMYGKQQDVALFSDDILFIPTNIVKAAAAASGVSVVATILNQAGYLALALR